MNLEFASGSGGKSSEIGRKVAFYKTVQIVLQKLLRSCSFDESCLARDDKANRGFFLVAPLIE